MKKAFHLLTVTGDACAPLVLRLTLALVMFPHGAQKVLGWFGGYGFTATMGFLTGKMGLPYPIALLPVLTEFLGPLALVLGLFTRVAAFALAFNMVVAIALVHWQYGFFMNWSGQQPGEGIEYALLAIGIGLALVFSGGGRASADRAVAARTV